VELLRVGSSSGKHRGPNRVKDGVEVLDLGLEVGRSGSLVLVRVFDRIDLRVRGSGVGRDGGGREGSSGG
jgi:hypothetical protein